MHSTHDGINTDHDLCDRWAREWLALVAETSRGMHPDAVERIRRAVASLLRTDLSHLPHGEVLAYRDLLHAAFDPAYTGLPVEQTQHLGLQALLVLCTDAALTPAARHTARQLLLTPWLRHPLFALAALQPLIAAPDPGKILSALLEELLRNAKPGEIRVWRFVNEESPMIEVTSDGTGQTVEVAERPDLARALSRGEALVVAEMVVIPVLAGKTPFAAIEIAVAQPRLTALVLHVLLLVRVAEQALSRLHLSVQETNPVTWQRVLTNLAQLCTVTRTTDEILTGATNLLRQALPCERIGFWEHNAAEDGFLLRALSARVTAHPLPVGTRCPAEETPLQVVWYTGQPLLLGADWAQRFPCYPNANNAIHAMAVIPLSFEYNCLGILTLERLEARAFTRQDADWLTLVAGMLSAALRNVEAHQAMKRAQARLLEDAKMRSLGEMAAGIAHDFNNILMALMCNIELLGYSADMQAVQSRLPRLERDVLKARTIIQRMSIFGGKIDAQSFNPLLLAPLLHETIALLSPQLQMGNISVDAACDEDMQVQGNSAALGEVVTNLVTNALQAMPNGGRLTLACGLRDGTAWFSLRDTGVGMSPAVLARACEPFFSTKVGVGSGLGLSVSYGIIQRHGGELHLESEEGKGTLVMVELPRCVPETPVNAATRAPGQQQRILLVEDNEDIAESLVLLLRRCGYVATWAPTVREGLAHLADVPFDLVITDLVIGHESGDSVAQAVRQQWPGTPILLFSGSLDLRDGAGDLYDGILHKPVTMKDMRAALKRVLPRG
jgi:signal transduction histidine kinase